MGPNRVGLAGAGKQLALAQGGQALIEGHLAALCLSLRTLWF